MSVSPLENESPNLPLQKMVLLKLWWQLFIIHLLQFLSDRLEVIFSWLEQLTSSRKGDYGVLLWCYSNHGICIKWMTSVRDYKILFFSPLRWVEKRMLKIHVIFDLIEWSKILSHQIQFLSCSHSSSSLASKSQVLLNMG